MAGKLAEVAAQQEKAQAADLLGGMKEVSGVKIVGGVAKVGSMDELREVADMTLAKLESGVVVLGCVAGDKVNLVVKASKDVTKKGIHAGKIIKEAAAVVGGGGGGRPDMAQAGGKKPEALPKAFEKAMEVIQAQLG